MFAQKTLFQNERWNHLAQEELFPHKLMACGRGQLITNGKISLDFELSFG